MSDQEAFQEAKKLIEQRDKETKRLTAEVKRLLQEVTKLKEAKKEGDPKSEENGEEPIERVEKYACRKCGKKFTQEEYDTLETCPTCGYGKVNSI